MPESRQLEPQLIFSQEHQYILKRLSEDALPLLTISDEKSLSLSSIKELKNLNSAWLNLVNFCQQEIEENHHRKEETFLFSAVRGNPKITAGGPMCTMYFDSHMFFTTIKVAQALALKITAQEFLPTWTEDLEMDRVSNSPLTIPGEDHEASRILLRAAQKILETDLTLKEHLSLVELLKLYIEIQKQHFQREENCFFPMCKNLLPPQRWQQIGEEIESRYKTLASAI